MSLSKDFKVAIVGGGMCGLACAVGLTKAGIKVDVFETAPKFEEVGAGVGLGPNAIRALDGLGVLEAVLTRTDHPAPIQRPFRFISGLGEHEWVYDYPTLPEDNGLGIHRAAFLEALLTLVDPGITHFNKRCISISASPISGAHVLHFGDGTTHEADVIVGADGIKSTVRNFVASEDGAGKLVFTNSVAYRGLIPTEMLKLAGVKTDLTLRPVCFVGRDKHIITFPIKLSRSINIVAFSTDRQSPMGGEIPHPWVTPTSQQELLDDFKGWGTDVMKILKCLEKPNKWSVHALHPPLPNYVRERVVLVGDAAHGMQSHLGAGVGQGFEDVFVLCQLLCHPQTVASNISDILQAYNNIRPPRANMVLERSTEMGKIYESYGENGYTIEDMQKHLSGMWEPVWHHDLGEEVREAFERLKQKGTFVSMPVAKL